MISPCTARMGIVPGTLVPPLQYEGQSVLGYPLEKDRVSSS